jgi:hypothetical protein
MDASLGRRADAAGGWGTRHADLKRLCVSVRIAVRFNVMLGRLFRMLAGLNVVPVGQMCMVGGRFMISVGVVFRGFAVMARSVFMMIRCLVVMMGCFV